MKDYNDIRQILDENRYRNEAMFSTFNPITGEGSIGERVRIEIPDFPFRIQWIPKTLSKNKFIRTLIRHKGIDGMLINVLNTDPSDENRRKVIDRYIRLRSLHDFPFWAASFVYIQNKEGGENVLFRLTYPQRKFVERLESFRLAGKPIRLVLLKARQWGGSTTSQLYMAWLQLVHRKGLNSLIATHVLKATANIKQMFRRMIDAYPTDLLHEPGEKFNPKEPKLVWVGGSDNTQEVPARNFSISIGSAQAPDSIRSANYSLVHLSEVGLWKETDGKCPEDLVRSACSGVLFRPYTMVVYESTANGVGNFFHTEYKAAANPNIKSQFEAMFVPWFDIELYRLPFASDNDLHDFATFLFRNRNNADAPSNREEPGRYLWWLWQKGASLEGIHWYMEERAKFNDHGAMASEYPSDDIEAFVNSGADVFDMYAVEKFRPSCRPPRFVGDIYGRARDGKDSLRDLRFSQDSQGCLWVWSLPDSCAVRGQSSSFYSIDATISSDQELITDRYLTVVDIGGRSDKADWSVIAVFDRLPMIDGDKPAVVAQWYGHIDMDLLAWKAAQIAAFYDNSLLVIESNTLETHDRDRNVDGNQATAILSQIKDVYDNLYARRQSEEAIRQGLPARYGFHTNIATKGMVISTLVKVIRECLYVERDERCLNEYLDYERKQNGAFGAKPGAHDDLLMTRAIGLHICFYEMDPPRIISRTNTRSHKKDGPISEAVF